MTKVPNIRQERATDAAAREALLDVAYGPSRHIKSSAKLRAERLPADGLSFVATARGRIVGTVRLWHVAAGRGRPALLLGPLAVHPAWRNRGIGAALTAHAVAVAKGLGHGAVLLVGDAPYYERFGFSADKTGALRMPGPYERHRLLGCELSPGALDGAHGVIHATGAKVPGTAPATVPAVRPDLPAVAAGQAGASRAA
jgi:predicted N-acetyltransferase YhbS